MGIPTVILVGADKGGVGKTTVTRALLDYLAAKGIPARPFDTEYPNGVLVRFAGADVVDITRVKDQMRIFDDASADTVSVVDLRAGLLSVTIDALDESKLLDEVRAGRMNLVLLHVLGATYASMQEVTAAAKRIGGGCSHFLVKNHINATEFTADEKNDAERLIAKMAEVTVHVPQMKADAYQAVDTAGGSFVQFCQQGPSVVLRGLVRSWSEKVWAEFDRVGLIGSFRRA